MHRTPAQNLQREGRSLPREGRDHLFQWEVGISVGFSTETTGSQRNPETRRNPSYHYQAQEARKRYDEVVFNTNLTRLKNKNNPTPKGAFYAH